MKKIYSLVKATMSSDMNFFRIKAKTNSKNSLFVTLFISFIFMFVIWSNANIIFEKFSPLNLNIIVLSMSVFFISFITVIEGVYKSSSLLFNCRDDQLLLSLPIRKSTVLFIRIFKFYLFELMFSSMFFIPVIISYLSWTNNVNFTFFITSFIMLLLLPIIPIIISCIIGLVITALSSRFKYKNLFQTVFSTLFLLVFFYFSFSFDKYLNYVMKHSNSIYNIISKIYYPAGVYAKLISNFNLLQLLSFIIINVLLFVIMILLLSRFYFKINSRLKKVIITKKVNINNITIKSNSIYFSLIKKEFNTIFNTPVLIINSFFALVLFIILSIGISIKFKSFLLMISSYNNFGFSIDLIYNNLSLFVFVLIMVTSFMTSISNSLISLEGKKISILKSLPIKTKNILMSKVYTCLIITTPVLFLGDIILFFRLKISLFESILLVILSILLPLVSHFVGLIVNLLFPKLDYENSTEVVKQSFSSFLSVMIGMILLLINVFIVSKIIGHFSSIIILSVFCIIYVFINILLYLYLIKYGVKRFNNLSL